MEKVVSYTTASVYTETKEKINKIVEVEKAAHKGRGKSPSVMSLIDRLVEKEHARLVKNGTIKQD